MRVRVRLHGGLHIDLGMNSEMIELTPTQGPKVADIVRELGLRAEDVWLVSVNRNRVSNDFTVQNGDLIEIFPIVSGG